MSESTVDGKASMPESESIGLLISGADELRKALPLNEDGFNFMGRAHNLRGRNHYMYSILDEIEQVAMALTLSHDWFDERPEQPTDQYSRCDPFSWDGICFGDPNPEFVAAYFALRGWCGSN